MRKGVAIALSVLLVCVIACGLLICCSRQLREKRVEELMQVILLDVSAWQDVLETAVSQKSADKAVDWVMERYSQKLKNVEYHDEYAGIWLVTARSFATKEGILLSHRALEPIPAQAGTGQELQLLYEAPEFHLYRLLYYWD